MYLLASYVAFAGCWTLAADMGLAPRFPLVINGVGVGDKIIHFVVVGGFALVLSRALCRHGWRPARGVFAGMAIAATLATLEELTNLLTPYRGFSRLDLVANYSGIVCLTTLGWLAGAMREPSRGAAAPPALSAELLLPAQAPPAS
ncbi:MAG: hypothetical protein AAGB00_09380 [Planctomycetota bacterium]